MPCTTILVGKKASNDGSTIIGRNSDGSFKTKKISMTLPKDQPRVYKAEISRFEIELPDDPLRYSTMPSCSTKYGIWPAFGINEKNVAMTATETITSNPRVYGADPYVSFGDEYGGIGEADMVCVVLPYITSAREGVMRLGKILEEYGTYEDNGIAFADKDEIWWLETIGGHHWIAKRVPDDRVVIMPNQFGLDQFDFDDAYGAQKENMCSPDLKEFTEKNFLYLGNDWSKFNPRLAYGSRSDADHLYNTPRAWYMGRYFLERTFKWDGENADFTPESNDIPWSFVPEKKVTVEDIHYIFSSHYQGTPYNPYDKHSEVAGKYRPIGVPNTNISGIQVIRPYMPEANQAVQWLTMGGSSFEACFPVYTNVDSFPEYISVTPETVTTDSMYWQGRLIAALTDAHHSSAIVFDERYQKAVSNNSRRIMAEYDARIMAGESADILAEANEKLLESLKKESDKVLDILLRNASEHMKIKYNRGDK